MKKHCYLYIDDSGSRFPDKQQPTRKDGMDHFALGGILIEKNHKEVLKEKYIEFCKKWFITYPLHSTEIRGMRGNFAWLKKNSKEKEEFLEELQNLLISIPVIGFAAVIHRPGYNNRYKKRYGDKRWWMCKTTYSILIERVAKYALKQEKTFEVRFEQVGKKEDKAIIQYAKDLKMIGSPFDKDTSDKYHPLTCADYQKVILGDPRRRKKENLFIQIADLYLYPIVKRKYDPSYKPWIILLHNKKIIDAFLMKENYADQGIKYSCFDESEKQKI